MKRRVPRRTFLIGTGVVWSGSLAGCSDLLEDGSAPGTDEPDTTTDTDEPDTPTDTDEPDTPTDTDEPDPPTDTDEPDPPTDPEETETSTTRAEQPSFEIADASIVEPEVEVGDAGRVAVTVANRGDAAGEFEVVVRFGDLAAVSENVTLDGGERERLRVRRRIETAGTYPVRVNGEFVADLHVRPPPEPAALEITDATLRETTLVEGETATVSVFVANAGDESGEMEVTVRFGGDATVTRTVTVDGGQEREVEFDEEIEAPGIYEVTVNGSVVGDLDVGPDTLDTVRDVCAHYYPWYGAPAHDWRGGEWSLESPSTPVLGNYTSTDPAVIEQHLDWCHDAGITWLSVSWWGKGSHEDDRLKNAVLEHERAEELEWSILYETRGRLGGEVVDVDDAANRRRLREDVAYLADEYFHRDAYKHLDGRPVLYVYAAHALRGDVAGAYEAAVDAAGVRPYLVADVPETSTPDAHPVSEVADAVTTYNPYAPREDIESVFLDRLTEAYRSWHLASGRVDVDVVPTAIPGFDDTEVTHQQRDNPPLAPSQQRYERAAEVTRQFADGPVFVTSFNEWYEDTEIEPSEEHGEAYLRTTADVLATGVRTPPRIDGETLALSFERTVPESELNPDVEAGRDLTMLVERARFRDGDGQVVLDADVGGEEVAVSVLLGSYWTERAAGDTWRWFGGTTRTVLHASEFPTSGSVELVGRAAAEMSLAVRRDGEQLGEATVGPSHDAYVVEYG